MVMDGDHGRPCDSGEGAGKGGGRLGARREATWGIDIEWGARDWLGAVGIAGLRRR